MDSKHLCLLGFSKQTEQEIKRYIAGRFQETTFHWVSANNKQLEGVIINAFFLSTPQIQKYIESVSCPRVAVYAQEHNKSEAEKWGIPAIDIVHSNKKERDTWFSILMGNQAQPEPFTSAPQQQTSDEAPKLQEQETEPQAVGLNSDYRKLMTEIRQRKTDYIVTRLNRKITYLFPRENDAYINFARDAVPGLEKWQWQKLSQRPDVESLRRINIDQWLFETIWHSKVNFTDLDHSKIYKLIKWPQPFSQNGRTEALRLAAQIKFRPVTVHELADKTDYPIELVEKFLFATTQAGHVSAMQPTQEYLHEQASSPRPQDPERSVKQSFLGRLRKRLGL